MMNKTAAVTLKEAKKEALADAGVKKGDAVFKKAALDYDDDTGISKYEVEFLSGVSEYSYDINPRTGDILECEVDIDD